MQQFRKEVRESREVDFAVQAFAALNSNNFVRFFKLVSAASYLSSCILHRYFNQVNASYPKGSSIASIYEVLWHLLYLWVSLIRMFFVSVWLGAKQSTENPQCGLYCWIPKIHHFPSRRLCQNAYVPQCHWSRRLYSTAWPYYQWWVCPTYFLCWLDFNQIFVLSQCNSVQSHFGDAELLKTNALFCLSSSIVELSRTAYQEPDFSLPQRKSVVIERKRTVLIGEVVNGGPLPNPPQHNPVCSFASNNKYTGDGLSSEPPPAVMKGVDALWFLVP